MRHFPKNHPARLHLTHTRDFTGRRRFRRWEYRLLAIGVLFSAVVFYLSNFSFR